MKILKILLFTVLYGSIGWFLDSFARLLRYGDWINGTYLEIPWSPMYALGALIILIAHKFIKQWPLFVQYAVYAVVVPGYEYIGGIFSEWFAGRRLWDYTDIPLNFGGHTTVAHILAWPLLALVFAHYMHPFFLEKYQDLKEHLDIQQAES